MTLKTGRASGTAEVTIDYANCMACGLCVAVCKGAGLYMEAGKVCIGQQGPLGCMGCGQCMAVCPKNCIQVEGRDLRPDDTLPIPPGADYEQLMGLMLSRRSVRDFEEREVDREVLNNIISAASTAPMGVPPSEVSVLVWDSKDKVQELRRSMLQVLKKAKWMFSPWGITLMRPFMGKEAAELMREFVCPVVDIYLDPPDGEDYFFYNAPAATYFYASAYADPADPVIAATNAMLAAQSLGLGSCMLGIPGFLFKSDKLIKRKYGLPARLQPGMMVIFGYPRIKYQRGLRRRFAEVKYC